MIFSLHELLIMHAYSFGFDEGSNNRRPLNPYSDNTPQFEAYELGYNSGQDTRPTKRTK